MSEVKVRGLEELKRSLNALPRRVQKNILKSGIRAGAALIVKEAKSNVPIDKGTLKKAIKIKARRSTNDSYIKFQVGISKQNNGVGKKDAYYGHMVEFGTSKMSAQPFMRPALETQAPKVIDAVKKKLSQRLDKEIKKASNA